MKFTIAELRARLLALTGKHQTKREEDLDRKEIAEMFAECDRQSLEYGWKDKDDERHMLRDLPPDKPLPAAKADGKRYCRRCGAHKRIESFDGDSDVCRAHGSTPPGKVSAA